MRWSQNSNIALLSSSRSFGEAVDLSSYNSTEAYICPTDGYLDMYNAPNVNGIVNAYATGGTIGIGGHPGTFALPVLKGWKVYCGNAKPSEIYFRPLVNAN